MDTQTVPPEVVAPVDIARHAVTHSRQVEREMVASTDRLERDLLLLLHQQMHMVSTTAFALAEYRRRVGVIRP